MTREARGDVVVVRAFYEWPLAKLFPKAIDLGNLQNGDRLLVATAVFRNEPFRSSSSSSGDGTRGIDLADALERLGGRAARSGTGAACRRSNSP